MSEHTRNSVFSRLERVRVNPNLDDGHDIENERSAGSRESVDLVVRLNARRARPEQQAKSRPPVCSTPEEEPVTNAGTNRSAASRTECPEPCPRGTFRDPVSLPDKHFFDNPAKEF